MPDQPVTSGLFPVETTGVPTGGPVEGFHPYTLYVFVHNPTAGTFTVPFQIIELSESGVKRTLHEGELHASPFGAAVFSLTDVPGRTLEVNLRLPSPQLKPSVEVVRTFLADGARIPILWIGPSQFAPLTTLRQRPVTTVHRTAVLPIPRRRRAPLRLGNTSRRRSR